MNEYKDETGKTLTEQHWQTGLTILVVALLCWVGLTTQNTQVEVARIAEKVTNLEKNQMRPNHRIDELDRRVRVLETKQ